MKYLIFGLIAMAAMFTADTATAQQGMTEVSAKRKYQRTYRRGRGFTCGLYLRKHYGLPPAFNLARHWLTLSHTSPGAGVIVVQSRRGRALGGGPGGHVARIVQVTGPCTAIVNDNRGTYSRNICKNLLAYVRP